MMYIHIVFPRSGGPVSPSERFDGAASKESAMDGFEWDPRKEAKNIAERGLDFTAASRIWGGPVLERIDARRDYGETRVLAFGKADGRLMAVLYTWRDTNRRIISARKANQREQKRFKEEMEGRPAEN
jgi:uncharacterized protein